MTKEEWIDKAYIHLKSKNLEYVETVTHKMTPEECFELASQLYDTLSPEQMKESVEEFIDTEISYWND